MDRRHLRFAVSVTALALPILVIDNIPRHDANAEQVPAGTGLGGAVNDTVQAHQAHAEAAAQRELELARQAAVQAAATTTAPPTTAPPATTTPSTTAPPVTQPPAPPPTAPPTTAPAPPPTDPPPPPLPLNTEEGTATWYRQPARYAPDGCAHKTLPFGTVVTVTNLNTGGSTFCIVSDRGPYPPGRVIDLDDDVFLRLAPLGAGIIPVIITWS